MSNSHGHSNTTALRRESRFIPLSPADLEQRGRLSVVDFVFVSGDAYVDHPSFAAALLCRVLEDSGFSVGLIPQPDWQNPSSYTVFGRPRLAFLVSSGNMDSMVAHYTAARRKRSEDAFSPGGKPGLRPDRALLKYVEGIRRAYKEVPVIIGGIEASLRRFTHYDYWSDTVRRSILLDSKADILVYGMGEKPLLEIAGRLAANEPLDRIVTVRGTCIALSTRKKLEELGINPVFLPSRDEIKGRDPVSLRRYAEHFLLQKQNADPETGKILAEENDGGRWVIQNPPAFPLSSAELDHIYELPFMRKAHPRYESAGGVPALKEVEFSLVSSRGCFGGCSFCAIGFHQGRAVTGRSGKSLAREAARLAALPGFKGYIHDVGGPTANFCRPACTRQEKGGFCTHRECLYPEPCAGLKADHGPYLELLAAVRSVPGVKKAFIRSGIRFDYIGLDRKLGSRFLETICRSHLSGQLKVAPEHVSDTVLAAMGKTGSRAWERFGRDFTEMNRKLALKQYLIPYFIAAHPGSTLQDAVELALFLKKSRFIPDQVQDFYPTPGTLSTVMYHTGLDPRNMEQIYVPKGERERKLQRALLQFNHPDKRRLVIEALREAGREDLSGNLAGRP
ncbi:MAG: YgiQ family radical SAM protein [Treponema sp.]|nr:YgiQ family radical SAM protein [Treponema sp.]